METMLAAALALSTIVATKALERTGQRIGDAVVDRSSQVMDSLRSHSPETATAIEAAPQNLDYPQVVETLKTLAENNPEVAQLFEELIAAAKADPNPKLSNFVSEQPTVYNAGKLAENIKNVFQGNTIIGGHF
ncbi:hypothetical protein [Roseofilum casamattae]|uniref:Uncharacterized protein n=1 Tax=Roseofilum casamattae BLCC-M143 TaxID=3022442 RepID=A0ABT7BSN2_9CYAN|nr:hypothetical protein [Roseofilum casamattae]MDJ1182205.1 hypothetical protein [Roseofilum casamattae BLCC-M143]